MESVIFIQHTEHSVLAQRIRENFKEFERVSRFRIKFVEKTGDKVVDLLHKLDSWSDQEDRKGDCRKRSIVCETYYLTCLRKI